MDIWATCEECVRTFYVPDSALEDLSQARCPVCDMTPERFEARGGDATVGVAVGEQRRDPAYTPR